MAILPCLSVTPSAMRRGSSSQTRTCYISPSSLRKRHGAHSCRICGMSSWMSSTSTMGCLVRMWHSSCGDYVVFAQQWEIERSSSYRVLRQWRILRSTCARCLACKKMSPSSTLMGVRVEERSFFAGTHRLRIQVIPRVDEEIRLRRQRGCSVSSSCEASGSLRSVE